MRYLVGFALVLALVASPVSGSAQDLDEGGSRLERWHPEGFEGPDKSPISSAAAPEEPWLKLEVDSTGLEVTPTAPPTLEELEPSQEERDRKKKRRRRLGLGIGLGVGLPLVGVVIGAAVFAATLDFSSDTS